LLDINAVPETVDGRVDRRRMDELKNEEDWRKQDRKIIEDKMRIQRRRKA
jgi:hypothetical protein